MVGTDSTDSTGGTEAECLPDHEAVAVMVPRSRRRSAGEWLVVVVGSVVIALLVKTFLVQAFYIPTGSMEPTLLGEQRSDGTRGTGDRVIVDKISYRLHDVQRGDVVVFTNPDKETAAPRSAGAPPVDDLIKRVVGLPGDTVVIKDLHVYVNGALLPEPYLPAGTATTTGPGSAAWRHTCTTTDPCTIPTGSVWVMGDNRSNSEDSRWLGPVREDTIVGRAVAVVWPLDRASGL